MFIVVATFEGDENSTTEINRSTTREWSFIKYNRAIDRWFDIIVELCAEDRYIVTGDMDDRMNKMAIIYKLLDERTKRNGVKYSFRIQSH
jgi:hypothetical protein